MKQMKFTCAVFLLLNLGGAQETAEVITADGTTANDGEHMDKFDFSNFAAFLKNSVFGQAESDDPFSKLVKKPSDTFATLAQFIQSQSSVTDETDRDEFLTTLVGSATPMHQQQRIPFQQMVDLFWNTTKQVREQLELTFNGTVNVAKLNPLQAYYYMLQQEAAKNSVYKRRQHAWMTALPEAVTVPMTDGLFLSQLAYANTCDDITTNLKKFHNNSWALLNCSVTGVPSRPAHFMAIRRVSDPLKDQPENLWERIMKGVNEEKNNLLEAVLVVRGTKQVADMMSDAMLEPADYRGGKAHDGILQSAIWLHETYKDFLENLLQVTGHSTLKLWLVGHSLGAGTAALACMEFNRQGGANGTTIDASALGFGTPAVVSLELSEAARSTITTVIDDDDCVPRMSGATLVNAWLNASASDSWIDESQADIRQLMAVMKEKLPFPDLTDKVMSGLLEWVAAVGEKTKAEQQDDSATKRKPTPVPQVLFPPGECVHLYRDGTGWQGVYMPCSYFDEIEAVLHMVSDHLIPSGYYRGLLGYIRGLKNDMNWRFEPDLIDLPVS
jgi:Lipase (class 3)